MHTLGGKADDDDGFSFFFFSFPVCLGFLSDSVGFFFFNSSSMFVTLFMFAYTYYTERYWLGFSFDLFGTRF